MYDVQIFSLKDGPLKSYSTPILTRHTSESTLPLASSEKANLQNFKLTGARRLGAEQQYVKFDGPQAWSAEYRLNEDRLDLAERLLNEKRLDEARRVLDEGTSDARPGGASALRGQLAALTGDCVTATRLFTSSRRRHASARAR